MPHCASTGRRNWTRNCAARKDIGSSPKEDSQIVTTVFTDGVTLSAAAWANDVDSTAYAVLTSVAGTNTITATGPGNYAYAAGRTPIYFVPAATNTGATTINVTPSGGAALGARNVFFNGAACAGGELVSGTPAAIIDDGTRFHIVSATLPATQAQQETGTHLGVMVSPGRQQFHPSAAKGWCQASTAGTAASSYNVTSVTDTGVGDALITWNIDFSTGSYCSVGSAIIDFGGTAATTYAVTVKNTSFAAGTTAINIARVSDGALTDPNYFMVVTYGDQ